MRDPKRQKEIIKALEKAWKKHPELRFCQWFYFITQLEDVFYMTDEEFLRLLKK